MPILTAETDFYPEDLWDHASAGPYDAAAQQWWCLHTKPRQEKAVARDLRSAKVSFYLPQVNNESHTPKGRKVSSLLPLFTSYLFLKGDQNARMLAMQGKRLVNVLEVFDQDTLELDLQRIHKLLSAGLTVSSEPRVMPETPVRIKTGPLAGIQGTVIRRGNGDHFVATVQFLSCGASVELQDWQVEPIIERCSARLDI